MTQEDWNKGTEHPLQSWEWGEFREKMGNKVTRISGDHNYQIVWTRVKPTSLWFGYCPMSKMPTEKDLRILKNESGIGIRFEPNEFGGITAPESLVPGRHLFKPKTFWINLTLSEEELLKKMTSKCRYNIRLAEKHGIKIKEEKDVESYLRLMFGNTTKRQRIYSHSESYHKKLLELDFVKMFTAKHKDKVIAVWAIFVWKDFVYYAYGAFDDEYKNLMAPVLGLWEIIKWSKSRGFKTLDLWGAEEGKGFSRFKEQFGPELVEMAGTWDLPINPGLYKLFRRAEEIRWRILRSVRT